MFESENKILSKEGVLHFLELFETQLLPFSPEVSEVTPAGLPCPLRRRREVKAFDASHVTFRNPSEASTAAGRVLQLCVQQTLVL